MKYCFLSLVLMLGLFTSCTNTQNEQVMTMNETIENLKTRRAIRSYQDKMPDMELVKKVVEAGTYAPTGMGKQSPIIVAVTDKAVRDTLSRLNARVMGSESDPFYGAPVVLVVLADRSVPTHVYDGALVMGNLMNAAHALGIGSCWINRADEVFEKEEGKALLSEWGLKDEYIGVGNCILGYPKEESQPHPIREGRVFFVR